MIGGLLALVGPFLTWSTATTTIAGIEKVTIENLVEGYPIGYLCAAVGLLAIVLAVVASIRRVPALASALLLAVFAIAAFLGLIIANGQGVVDTGSECLEGGVAIGAAYGLAPTAFTASWGIGTYFILIGATLLALAAPLALKRK